MVVQLARASKTGSAAGNGYRGGGNENGGGPEHKLILATLLAADRSHRIY